MNSNFEYFKDRNERADFILNKFKKFIDDSESILDVGCDNNAIKQKLPNKNVTGIDIEGNPDIVVNLDKEKLSRFSDNSFDFIVCTEVLEHLDDFHSIVDELFRVSNKYVLISLPNCMDFITKYNFVFHDKLGKYYGLPLKKTNDRHKWVFSWKDLDIFFETYCKNNNLKIIIKFLNFNLSNSIKARIFRFIIKLFNIESASQSYWILLSK